MRRSLFALPMLAIIVSACAAPPGPDDSESGQHDGSGDIDAAIPPWPAMAEATIRPGVPINGYTQGSTTAWPPGGSCTMNFVFASPDNRSLYVGTAAHCLDQEIGQSVAVGLQGNQWIIEGRLAYHSWTAMNASYDALSERCTTNRLVSLDDSKLCWNDFALVEIDLENRSVVHPAMLGFGGPTGIATSPESGEMVLTYGNSYIREPAGEALDARHGAIIDVSQWRVLAAFDLPGYSGDSGSGVIDSAGRAVGVMIYLHQLPPGTNGVARLDALLDAAREDAAIDVRLVEWPLLEGITPT